MTDPLAPLTTLPGVAEAGEEARDALGRAHRHRANLRGWPGTAAEAALRAALIDGAGLKPRVAFGPLRTAISGRRVSPPLFESMEILDKESTLARLERLRRRL